MTEREWRPTNIVAWTEHDGPGRPPRGAAGWMWTATAGTLGLVLSVVFMTDALCPEHRMWVEGLATLAFFGSIVAIVGLTRGWAIAPLLTIAVAGIGAVIGAIDAAHSPVRGGTIALGFLVAMAFSAWLCVRQLPAGAWDRRLRRAATTELDLDVPVPPAIAVTDSQSQEAFSTSE